MNVKMPQSTDWPNCCSWSHINKLNMWIQIPTLLAYFLIASRGWENKTIFDRVCVKAGFASETFCNFWWPTLCYPATLWLHSPPRHCSITPAIQSTNHHINPRIACNSEWQQVCYCCYRHWSSLAGLVSGQTRPIEQTGLLDRCIKHFERRGQRIIRSRSILTTNN